MPSNLNTKIEVLDYNNYKNEDWIKQAKSSKFFSAHKKRISDNEILIFIPNPLDYNISVGGIYDPNFNIENKYIFLKSPVLAIEVPVENSDKLQSDLIIKVKNNENYNLDTLIVIFKHLI